METLEWRFTDKSEWDDGPWQSEPDKKQWLDEETGLPCLIHRGGSGGLCGYVGISADHPDFQKDYDNVDYDVHGGLTFANFCADVKRPDGSGICHIVEEGENDRVWWFGFDCAHSGDYTPMMSKYRRQHPDLYRCNPWETYKDLTYVERQVKALARQLKARTQPQEGEVS